MRLGFQCDRYVCVERVWVMTAVVRQKLAERRVLEVRVNRTPCKPSTRDSRQTSFPTEFLEADYDDTAKAAREIEKLRKLFV